MKVAIPVWGPQVSTVFDFSDRLLIADIVSGTATDRSVIPFTEINIASKAARLQKLGVNTLLCGAISVPLTRMIEAGGIVVVPFLRGMADDILNAYLAGQLMDGRFALPGCAHHMGPGRGKGMGRRGRRGGWGHSMRKGR